MKIADVLAQKRDDGRSGSKGLLSRRVNGKSLIFVQWGLGFRLLRLFLPFPHPAPNAGFLRSLYAHRPQLSLDKTKEKLLIRSFVLYLPYSGRLFGLGRALDLSWADVAFGRDT